MPTITAQVLDNKTKKPFPNVNVRLNESVVAQTNSEGKFTLDLKAVADNDVIELTYVGYDLYFAPANNFPKVVYLDNRGFALSDLPITTRWIKTNWYVWLILGVGAASIYAYKKNTDNKKKIVKAKI